MRELYPEIEPRETFFLDVGDGHVVYGEESGNPAGKPVDRAARRPRCRLVPEATTVLRPRRLPDRPARPAGLGPEHARTPSVEHNTTWDLVARRRAGAHAPRDRPLDGLRRVVGLHPRAGVRRAPSRGRHRDGAARDLPAASLGAAVPLSRRRLAHLPRRVGGLRRADPDRRARRHHRRVPPAAVR